MNLNRYFLFSFHPSLVFDLVNNHLKSHFQFNGEEINSLWSFGKLSSSINLSEMKETIWVALKVKFLFSHFDGNSRENIKF